MAIVQISKIQHRRGTNENLPQLASAELGWSIDTRQLYIGNGTIEEGAPKIGNTEILTEYSDLLSIAQAYTFKGQLAGYVAQTGTSVSSPISRSLQDKLDDFVNIRDFGAIGDGVTDDTNAINHAMEQIYCVSPTQPLVRRTIYFPAGNYLVSDFILIPPNARLQGDGLNRTFITRVPTTAAAGVIKLADSNLQVDAAIGQNEAAILPGAVDLNDLSLINQNQAADSFVMGLVSATDVTCNNVGFKGGLTDLSLNEIQSYGVKYYGNGATASSNIKFNNCHFADVTHAVNDRADIGAFNVTYSGCKFYNCYNGIALGEVATTTPTSIRIIGCSFDNIYAEAVRTYDCSNIISAFNYYANVGNAIDSGSPVTAVINFNNDDCYSFGDIFDRTDAQAKIFPRVETNHFAVVTVIPHESLRLGERGLGNGRMTTLLAGRTYGSNTSIGLTLDETVPGAVINYTIQRATGYRTGKFTVVHNSSLVSFEDEYHETSNGFGIELYAVNDSGSAVVCYSSDSGVAATMKYSVDYFKY